MANQDNDGDNDRLKREVCLLRMAYVRLYTAYVQLDEETESLRKHMGRTYDGQS